MAGQNGKQGLRIGSMLLAAAVVVASTGCSVIAMVRGVRKPAAAEFGLGPRISQDGLYTATLEPAQPLRTRKLQTIRVVVKDAKGRPVDDAAITIDGGMPQHGHGLPTQPRVTQTLGDGVYVIDGVRFSMGGWWELKLAIAGKAGTGTVTFNLAL